LKRQIERKHEETIFFALKDYEQALGMYGRALKIVDLDADTEFDEGADTALVCTVEEDTKINALKLPIFLNQAACHLKLGEFKPAQAACNKALELESKNVKALFRRGQAWQGLTEYPNARADFTQASNLDPTNQEIKKAIAALTKLEVAAEKKEREMFSKMF